MQRWQLIDLKTNGRFFTWINKQDGPISVLSIIQLGFTGILTG